MAIRYMKLENPGGNGWVVRMKIGWQGYDETVNDQGIVVRKKNSKSGTWEKSEYDDICVYSERTVDIKEDTDIPNKAEVWLKPFIVGGKDGPDSKHFIYDETSGDMAEFSISGALWGTKTLKQLKP